MSKSSKTSSGTSLTQFVVPAAVGAVISAAAFAAFITLGPKPAPGPVSSTPPSSETGVLSDGRKAAIEQTVRDYLLKNPQILMQMSERLEKQQAEAKDLMIKTAISKNADLIYRDNYGLGAGNPKGDVTIVEFSDYNCPYCKRAFKDLAKLIDGDKKVRVVLKEYPIFGERSEGAARVAIAARLQGRYFDVHSALLTNRGQNNEQTALRLAEQLGLDMDKLKSDMASPEVVKIINETRELGNKLGIQGTPFYLVGDRTIPGAPDDLYQVFKQNVADVRKNGCQNMC